MQRDADVLVPEINKSCIRDALKYSCRVDGRSPFDARRITFAFALDDAGVLLSLGDTKVHASIAATLEEPRGASTEGRLLFNIDFSPMASAAFGNATRMDSAATAVAALLQRTLADGGAVDLEALTVSRGRRAWTLRCGVRVLAHDGGIVDGALLGAMAALSAFRLPQTQVSSSGAVSVLDPASHEPVGLTIQHVAVATSFALFGEGDALLADATRTEAAAADGVITIVATPFGELCAIEKRDGVGLRRERLAHAARLASSRAADVGAALRAALDVHVLARVERRVRRSGTHGAAAAPTAASAVTAVVGTTAEVAARVAAAHEAAALSCAVSASAPRRSIVVGGSSGPEGQPLLPSLAHLAVSEAADAGTDSAAGPDVGTASLQRSADDEAMDATNATGATASALTTAAATVPPVQQVNIAEPSSGEAGPRRKRKKRPPRGDAAATGVGVLAPAIAADSAPVKRPGNGKASSLSGRRTSKYDLLEPELDNFEEIAAMIAGPRVPGASPPTLEECIDVNVKKAQGS